MVKNHTELSFVVNSYDLYEELHFTVDGILYTCWWMYICSSVTEFYVCFECKLVYYGWKLCWKGKQLLIKKDYKVIDITKVLVPHT